jgi:hypothetical protein
LASHEYIIVSAKTSIMFTNTIPGMSISINGGSEEENSQLCTVVAAALRSTGFRNVQLDASNEFHTHTHHDMDTIMAMRRLNPDLFDTHVVVAGESEDDMRVNMAAMGIGNGPFAFQVERAITF